VEIVQLTKDLVEDLVSEVVNFTLPGQKVLVDLSSHLCQLRSILVSQPFKREGGEIDVNRNWIDQLIAQISACLQPQSVSDLTSGLEEEIAQLTSLVGRRN